MWVVPFVCSVLFVFVAVTSITYRRMVVFDGSVWKTLPMRQMIVLYCDIRSWGGDTVCRIDPCCRCIYRRDSRHMSSLMRRHYVSYENDMCRSCQRVISWQVFEDSCCLNDFDVKRLLLQSLCHWTGWITSSCHSVWWYRTRQGEWA